MEVAVFLVFFLGSGRCFCGFHTVDIRCSHLSEAVHVSVPKLTASLDSYHQQPPSYVSDRVHRLFTLMLLFPL